MKITIVTVCYNTVSTIEKTILSVINQTYQDIEYIVIDGASTDGTVDVINKYANNINVFISEPDKGIYDAMNKGIALATGDYINFMNAGDNFSSEDAIEKVVCLIDPKSDIVYGDSICVFPDGNQKIIPGGTRLELLAKRPIYRHNASFTKTELHKRVPFALDKKGDFEYALDYNNIFTLWHNGAKFQKIDVNVVTYLREGTSDRPVKNVILPFRVSHQFRQATIKELIRFCIDLIKAYRISLLRKK